MRKCTSAVVTRCFVPGERRGSTFSLVHRRTAHDLGSSRTGWSWRHKLVPYRSAFRSAAATFASKTTSAVEIPEHILADRDHEPGKNGHGDRDADERLLTWAERVLITPLAMTAEQEHVRAFWEKNVKRYESRHFGSDVWHWSTIAENMFVRKLPLRKTFTYAIYSSVLSAGLLFLSSGQSVEFLAPLLSEAQISTGRQAATHLLTEHDSMTSATGFLATALFLTLTFRINRAASRWWSGRMELGRLITDAQGLSQTAQLSISSKDIAVEIGLLSYGMVRSVELYSRRSPPDAYRSAFATLLSDEDLEFLTKHLHPPSYFTDRIFNRLRDAYDAGDVKNVRLLVAMESLVKSMNQDASAMERINSMPEPWSYQKHMRFIIECWLGILPLALLPTLQAATPIFASVTAYTVYKLDDVAIEMTSPFGFDRSDIHMCVLVDQYANILHENIKTYVQW